MARYRTHSIEFKRQLAQEYVSGETLHGLAKRHDVTRNLIRVWVRKYEEGAFDDERRRPTLSRNTKPGSPPLSGWSVSRLWNWSF